MSTSIVDIHTKVESLVSRCTNKALCDILTDGFASQFKGQTPDALTSRLVLNTAQCRTRDEILRRCIDASPELGRAIDCGRQAVDACEQLWIAEDMPDSGATVDAWNAAASQIDDMKNAAIDTFITTFGSKR